MKLINLDKQLTYFDKKTPIKLSEKSKPITVREVFSNLCAAGYKQPSSIDIVRLYKLANAIYEAKKELEVDADDVTLIKKVSEANIITYSPYVLAQALIESGIEKEEKK